MSNLTADTITNWDETGWIEFRDWLREQLRKHPVEVTFIKTDGSERVMRCSLESKYVDAWSQEKIHRQLQKLEQIKETPSEFQQNTDNLEEKSLDLDSLLAEPSQEKYKNTDPLTLRVFDLDKQQWRSFKVKKITNIYQLLIRWATN